VTPSPKPRLLILSFSTLVADARLLRQIQALREGYEVTTCGYGPAPFDDIEHIEVPEGIPPMTAKLQAVCMRTKLFRAMYWLMPQARAARRALRGRTFDAILANDLDTAGLALSLENGAKVHLDLHEYWLGLHDNVPAWVRLRVPYYSWQLRHWATKMRSVTTINEPLAQRYRNEFGLECGIVTNAGGYQDLTPTPVTSPIRLVHSGAARPNRELERMMHAVAAADIDVTLDLYLIGEGTAYYESLLQLATELGDRVRILPPVSHDELVPTLNQYDVGLPFLPPTTSNIEMTLPNKFFDYVQARLAILTGPTPPMVEILDQYGLGVVSSDFETASLTATMNALTRVEIERWKNHANEAARPLSGEVQNETWVRAIREIA